MYICDYSFAFAGLDRLSCLWPSPRVAYACNYILESWQLHTPSPINPAIRLWNFGARTNLAISRPDKYSKKVFRYFAEYADKEAKKKSYAEVEQHKSTEAWWWTPGCQL